MLTPPPQSKVWLYRGAYSVSSNLRFSNVSSALLELTSSTVRCTLTNKAGYSRWLATRIDVPDLKQRLRAGEHVTVFEFRHSTYHINSPGWFNGTVLEIGQGNGPDWIVGLLCPYDFEIPMAVFRGGDVRRQWRQALDPTRRQWTPPGWYADPADTRAERYWDGTRWTSFAHPSPWSYPGHP